MEIHPGISAYKVSQHFEGVIQNRTVYNVIKDIKKRGNIDRKVGSGPKSNLDKPEVKRKLVKATVGKISKSYRFFGTKFKVDHQTVKKHLEKLGIRRKSRKCKPKVTEKQKIVQKTRLRKFKEKVKKRTMFKLLWMTRHISLWKAMNGNLRPTTMMGKRKLTQVSNIWSKKNIQRRFYCGLR